MEFLRNVLCLCSLSVFSLVFSQHKTLCDSLKFDSETIFFKKVEYKLIFKHRLGFEEDGKEVFESDVIWPEFKKRISNYRVRRVLGNFRKEEDILSFTVFQNCRARDFYYMSAKCDECNYYLKSRFREYEFKYRKKKEK